MYFEQSSFVNNNFKVFNYLTWSTKGIGVLKGLCDVLKPYNIFCYMKSFFP